MVRYKKSGDLCVLLFWARQSPLCSRVHLCNSVHLRVRVHLCGGVFSVTGTISAESSVFCVILYGRGLLYDRFCRGTRPEDEQHMVFSTPGLVCLYDSSGNSPPPQKAAGHSVTILFLREVTFPSENHVPSGCAHMKRGNCCLYIFTNRLQLSSHVLYA